MEKVAVILPVYKNDKVDYLKKSVESILLQTHTDIHLYIGVDGPIPSELRKCLDLWNLQTKVSIKWFSQNRGLACVLNDLLDICFKDGYEYIARMDADDISMLDRIEKQMSFLDRHLDVDVVGGAIDEIDEKGARRNKVIVYPASPQKCRAFFSKRNPHAHPTVLFRKRYFEKANCKYRPEYRQNQDTMLWYDGMMKDTQHANVPDVVLQFRMTDTLFKKRRNGWTFAKKQFKDRLMINRGLGYGWKADVYGFTMFCILVSPAWIKRVAYRLLR